MQTTFVAIGTLRVNLPLQRTVGFALLSIVQVSSRKREEGSCCMALDKRDFDLFSFFFSPPY